jgi:uncharacterized protein HemX
MGNTVEILIGVVTALGGLSLVKFLFFMNPEKRKAAAEADIKEVEKEERKLGVMEQLVKSLQERIEQQDQKIKELNDRLDKLYVQLHEQERVNNALVKENNELRLALKEAEHNVCVRPDDECFKGRLPKRTYCRLKKLAAGEYDAFYNETEEESPATGDTKQ